MSEPTVTLTGGTVRGTNENGVEAYRGIPYAAAPTGALRFAPPEPPAPWSGVRDATAFGPSPLQNLDPLSMAMPGAEHYYYNPGTATFGEDALSVNVWTPRNARPASLPVMVWIHGGGFLTGSGASDWFDGGTLARRENIVVVTISYRLGVLGNLWLGDLDPEATNLGTRDQVAALEWVRDEIGSFGGDASRVTVVGQSAGGMSVAALLLAPKAKGLFRGAVIQSGHAGLFQDREAARATTDRILRALRIDRGPATLDALRAVSSLRLLEAQRLMPIGTVGPTLDGEVLPLDALEAYRGGVAAHIPLIIGTTAAENALFRITGMRGMPDKTGLRDAVIGLAGATALDPAALDEALAEYRADAIDDDEAWNRVTTDLTWAAPVNDFVEAYQAGGGTAFRYEFAWRSPARGGLVGAAHEVDVPFVFDALGAAGVQELLGDGVAQDAGAVRLAHAMSAAWAAFVRTGEPRTDLLPRWEATSPSAPRVMVLDVASRLMADAHPARTALWAQTAVSHALVF